MSLCSVVLRTAETLSGKKMESFDILRYNSLCERRDATRALPKKQCKRGPCNGPQQPFGLVVSVCTDSILNGYTGRLHVTLCPSTLQTVTTGGLNPQESFLTVLDVECIDTKVRANRSGYQGTGDVFPGHDMWSLPSDQYFVSVFLTCGGRTSRECR